MKRELKRLYEKYYSWLIVALVAYALFLRIFRLGDVPRGLHVDEVGMAYDAWSISQFGVDRYLNSYPVYLTNFGGGQSVLYCYLLAAVIKLCRVINPVLIRLPGVIMSMLTCVFGFLLIKRVRGKDAGIIYLLLCVCVPYFTQAGRVALDCNLMLGMSVLILYLLEKCLHHKGKMMLRNFVLLGITTGVTFYTYALSYLIIPSFFLLLCIILRICRIKINIKNVVAFILPVILLAVPLVLVQLVNSLDLNEMIIGRFTITKLLYYRGNEISLREIKDNIGWIYRSIFTADNTEFDSFRQFGTLYHFSFPIIVAGGLITVIRFVRCITERRILFDGIILLYLSIVLVSALFIQGVTTYRINSAFFGFAFLIVVALEYMVMGSHWETINKLWMRSARCVGFCLILTYVVASVFFFRYYFYRYENEIYPQRLFAEDPTEAYKYVEDDKNGVKDRLTYVGGVDEAYIYYMLFMHIPPYDYKIDQYGNNGDGEHYIFYSRAPYDPNCNYIMYLPDKETVDELIREGFMEHDLGTYRVYTYGK